MKKLLIAFVIIATLGSIYPFEFRYAPLDAATLRAFAATCCTRTGRGDILGNILLFMPIGFAGMLAFRPDATVMRRLALLVVTSVVFATLLQVLQLYLPSRDESLQDVIWNLCGTLAGAGVAIAAGSRIIAANTEELTPETVPIALIASWLTYRLIPFVPSIDLQLYKDSLKPVLQGGLSGVDVLHDMAAWLVVAYLLRMISRERRLDAWLALLIAGTFVLEIVIVSNSLSSANIVGALLAVVLWRFRSLIPVRSESLLVALLLLSVVLSGLEPFVLSPYGTAFNWYPFYGFLGGSMYLNTLSAAEKVFLYGSMVFLLQTLAVGRVAAVGLVFGAVFVVELLQTRFIGHTPEITDPVLVLLAAAALWWLGSKDERTPQRSPAAEPEATIRTRKAARKPGGKNADPESWTSQKIHLRRHQLTFVETLAAEMDASPSRVMRRIVSQVLDENDGPQRGGADNGIEAERWARVLMAETEASSKGSHSGRWRSLRINLRRKQYDRLSEIADEFDVSVSRVTRGIAAYFIAQLDEEREEPT